VVLVLAGLPLVWRTVRGALRGQFATDIVASLSIVTAVALRQPIPGLVIVLMQAGGEWLERYAARRASRAIQALEDASPRNAHRVTGEVLGRALGLEAGATTDHVGARCGGSVDQATDNARQIVFCKRLAHQPDAGLENTATQ
jgi:hypothetical protein